MYIKVQHYYHLYISTKKYEYLLCYYAMIHVSNKPWLLVLLILILRSKYVHCPMVTRHTQEGGVLAEVDAGGNKKQPFISTEWQT